MKTDRRDDDGQPKIILPSIFYDDRFFGIAIIPK